MSDDYFEEERKREDEEYTIMDAERQKELKYIRKRLAEAEYKEGDLVYYYKDTGEAIIRPLSCGRVQRAVWSDGVTYYIDNNPYNEISVLQKAEIHKRRKL